MPHHHPEDRVSVKNIVAPKEPLRQTFYLNRVRKEPFVDERGNQTYRDVPYVQEVDWNFQDGFFFLWGGKAYVLRPGEEKPFPRFLAEHFAKQVVQHVLNEEYAASKSISPDGIPIYGRNILNNKVREREIRNQVIIRVEEWYEGTEDDFDSILARQYGGDADSLIKETRDNGDFMIEVEDEDLSAIKEAQEPKKVAKSPDKDVQRLRDECDANSVAWDASDGATELKSKLLKAMA